MSRNSYDKNTRNCERTKAIITQLFGRKFGITKIRFFFVAAISEVYKNEGNDEYKKKNFNNAIYFYTEGINVDCKDEELNAKLYSNRAAAHFNLGRKLLSFLYIGCLLKYLIFCILDRVASLNDALKTF